MPSHFQTLYCESGPKLFSGWLIVPIACKFLGSKRSLIYVAGSVGLHNLLLQQVLQMALIQGTGDIFIYSPKPYSTLPNPVP